MKHLFVVAAGGTGAKVMESLIHLCAAGMGPESLDILLLDVDQSNGNVERTRETVEQYRKMRQWDWSVNPSSVSKGGNVPLGGTQFFRTACELHICLDAIETVGDGGLAVHLRAEEGARDLLDLLYDSNEQMSECERGFLARPNLGALVLGGHLYQKFSAETGGASAFKARLLDAANGATVENPVIIAVVGSIFGGTGASLFPVICQRIEEAVRAPNGGTANWEKLAPVAVMLSPYFLPNQGEEEVTVDPSRFLADTANTLSHYAQTDALDRFKAVYLIGSDQPQLNRLRYVDGSRDQANPPFVEELVAALAVLDALNLNREGRTRIYQPPGNYVDWANLPFPRRGQGQLALLLNLAAFLLLPFKDGQPLSGGLLAACEDWGDEFELLPFFESLLGSWAQMNFSHEFGQPSRPGEGWKRLSDENFLKEGAVSTAKGLVGEYAYRLLLWARTALPNNDPYRLVKLGENMDYAVVWETMCGLTTSEIEPLEGNTGTKDNALVRLARGAAAALAKVASGQTPPRGIINPVVRALPGFPGQGDEAAPACGLPIDQNALKSVAVQRGIPESVHAKFTKTEIPPR